MNDKKDQEDLSDKTPLKKSVPRKKEKSQTSKLGYLVIFLCVVIVGMSMVTTRQIDERALPEPNAAPADTINLISLSTSWTCPMSGNGQNGDLLTLANPDKTRTSFVSVSTFGPDGTRVNKEKFEIAPSSKQTIEVVALKADASTFLFIESFSSSVAAFRTMYLSDGPEVITCINNLDSRADFPNLETSRNSNSVIALANPFGEAIVVDLIANLVDNSVNPPIAVLDEVRGIIVPSHGKLDFDLQKEFGRYSLVSAHLKSRSGFFAAEALVSFNGANSVQGQAVISSSRNIAGAGSVTWVGASPTRITAYNESQNSASLGVTAIALDKRSVVGESAILTPGTTSILNDVGMNFLGRTTIVNIDKGSQKPKSIYASWLHTSPTAVSGGAFAISKSTRSIVPVLQGDSLRVYNPGDKQVSLTISQLGTKATQKIKIDASSYEVVPLTSFQFETVEILQVSSKSNVFVASTNDLFTRHSPGIEVRS